MDDIHTWFNSWARIWSVVQAAVFFFVLIVFLSRIGGKRLTGQLNNFDWIITVAVGSLMASGILLKDVSVADTTVAILVLAALQWGCTWLAVRSERFAALLKPPPRLLLDKGKVLKDSIVHERIAMAELEARLRQEGFTSLADANWVILETNGKLSVIPRSEADWAGFGLRDGVAAPEGVQRSPRR